MSNYWSGIRGKIEIRKRGDNTRQRALLFSYTRELLENSTGKKSKVIKGNSIGWCWSPCWSRQPHPMLTKEEYTHYNTGVFETSTVSAFFGSDAEKLFFYKSWWIYSTTVFRKGAIHTTVYSMRCFLNKVRCKRCKSFGSECIIFKVICMSNCECPKVLCQRESRTSSNLEVSGTTLHAINILIHIDVVRHNVRVFCKQTTFISNIFDTKEKRNRQTNK